MKSIVRDQVLTIGMILLVFVGSLLLMARCADRFPFFMAPPTPPKLSAQARLLPAEITDRLGGWLAMYEDGQAEYAREIDFFGKSIRVHVVDSDRDVEYAFGELPNNGLYLNMEHQYTIASVESGLVFVVLDVEYYMAFPKLDTAD